MIAKEQTDDGWLSSPNATALATEIGTTTTSVLTWIKREANAERISNVQKRRRLLCFYINHYNDSQGVRSFRDMKNRFSKGREGKQKGIEIEVEYVSNLKVLKIDKSIFEEYKKEIPSIDHDDELRKADLWRMDNPAKSKKPNDHLFLRNWFQRAKKGKDEKGESDLSKYDDL